MRIVTTNDEEEKANRIAGYILKGCVVCPEWRSDSRFHVCPVIHPNAKVVAPAVKRVLEARYSVEVDATGRGRILQQEGAAEAWLEVFALVLDIYWGAKDEFAGLDHFRELKIYFQAEIDAGRRQRLPWQHVLFVTAYSTHLRLIETVRPKLLAQLERDFPEIPPENVLPYPSVSEPCSTNQMMKRICDLANTKQTQNIQQPSQADR